MATPRFQVTKAQISELEDSLLDQPTPRVTVVDDSRKSSKNDSDKVAPVAPRSDRNEVTYVMDAVNAEQDDGLELYADDKDDTHTWQVGKVIANYSPQAVGSGTLEKQPQKTATMGTFMGVFLPCVQNIFGILFFIRLAWIVGTAGLLNSFFIVLICCLVTFTTSISLSAIATNGMVPAGGPYYMISRNLGPELGGAVGILFYLGTTIAASMYILGAAEIFVLYLVKNAKIFEDYFMCYRLYGTIVLIILSFIVLAGVNVVNKFALPTVIIVNLCILLSFIGIFYNINGSESLKFCVVGDRLPNLKNWQDENRGLELLNCTGTDLMKMFCVNVTDDESCEPYFRQMRDANRIEYRSAIRGLTSGVVHANADPKYMNEYQIMSHNLTEEAHSVEHDERAKKLYVYADVTSSFIILIGVFFPSVTGIMAGSNRSGNLKDPSIAIPRGTIAATTLTSIVYMLGAILFAASLDELFIRDKFGESAYGKLIIAELSVPHPMVMCVGSFIATTGAGMQSLTGAPRLLQAIAKDGIIPILSPLAVTDKRGEPLRAIFVTVLICEMGILIAMLESITALISQFFLMCYLGVNSACALQSLMKAPSWRPSFYYHWSLSMFGAALCISVMFMSHWIFAIVAIFIGVGVYKYIEYRGAEKEWGDGMRGLGLSAARYALLNLEEGAPHTKNWRPQALVLLTVDNDYSSVTDEKLLAFVSQLKAGKGLTVIGAVIEGHFAHMSDKAESMKLMLKEKKSKYKIKGFCEVLVCKDYLDGISSLIQTSGLGGLKHNTVLLSWPEKWKESENLNECLAFVDTIRSTTAAHCAVLVLKNAENFPDNTQKMTGNIHIWWVVHDGGMMMLLPFLLKQHRTWRHSKLHIFTVAQIQDNSVKMKEDLKLFLYHLRIDAEVDVIEMHDKDISDYTYERTLRMMQRSQMLRELGLSGKERDREIQTAVVDAHHKMSTVTAPLISPETITTPITPLSESTEPIKRPSVMFSDLPDKEITAEPSKDASPHGEVLSNGRPMPESGPASFIGLHSYNVRRMNTAVKLNELMKTRSGEAQLVFVNLPGPPKHGSDDHYMEFIEELTKGLERVVLVKGTGTEVVTIFS